MRCRSIPSVKPMPIRGQAELAEQAQATASGRHITGVPVPVVPAAWLQVIYIFFSLDLFIILNFWVDKGSTQALRPSLLDPVPLQGKDMLQFLPLPTFTCGCSTLGGVRTTAKPKAALSRLCFETGLCPGKGCPREGCTLSCSPGTHMCWGGHTLARVEVPPWGPAGWPG